MAKKTEEVAAPTGMVPYGQQGSMLLLPPETEGRVVDVGMPAPDFMEEDKGTGMERVRDYVKPARLKVIQDKRDEAYQKFNPGSVILSPRNDIVIAEVESPFWIVPVFFFTEYCTINDYRLKGRKPMIAARDLDPNGRIARLSRIAETRTELDPDNRPGEDFKMRHTEFLVFLSIIVKTPGLQATPCALSFSRGEYGTGQSFAALLDSRRPKPMFGCVFECKVPKKQRHNNLGDWYGIDVGNPSHAEGPRSPWVMDRQEYDGFRELHFKLAKAHAEKLIQVDHEDDNEQPTDGAAAAAGEAKF